MAALRLAPKLSSTELARRFAQDDSRRVQLLIAELLTRAVGRGGSADQLTVAWRDDRLRIGARDASSEKATPPRVDTPSRCRDLLLVEDLSEQWGVEVQDGDATCDA